MYFNNKTPDAINIHPRLQIILDMPYLTLKTKSGF